MRIARRRRPHRLRIATILQLEVEYGRGILRGVANWCRQFPDIAVLKFNNRDTLRRSFLEGLDADGIIAKISNAREERLFESLGIPVVNVSGSFPRPKLPTVNTDDFWVGRLAAQHLFSRGFQHLVYVGTKRHLGSGRRWEGFAACARDLGAKAPAARFMPPVELDLPYPDEVRSELHRWIHDLPKPLGVFTFTDQVALEVDLACHRAGLNIPDDVAILSTGNDATRLGFAHHEISSIQLNSPGIGFAAMELLHGLMQGRRPPPTEQLIRPVKIVARESTDRAAVEDPVVADALLHIKEHAANVIYVEDVAQAVNTSRRVLELRFRRALHTSVYAEIQRLHFERALELLPDKSLAIGEVADAAGFTSAQHFSTAFRTRYGDSPQGYRAKLIKPGQGVRKSK